jgi:uncharacterized protein (UPF0335 family)
MTDVIASEKLKMIVDKVERLTEQKAEIALEIAAVIAEARADGFDGKALREVLKLRSMDPQKRSELEELMDLYKAALGMA